MTAALKSIEARADAAIEQARQSEPPPFYRDGDPENPGKAAKPLSVVFADELPTEYTPPDELVEGLIAVGSLAIVYGDSNSGKTFFAIDLAAAVARGVDWMNRQTERSGVVYVAAEAPRSVMARLQAYQAERGTKVHDFAITQDPINLFSDDADANRIIEFVGAMEAERGIKVGLIVIDTLSRVSTGAKENTDDMGHVIRHMDRIRNECNAAVLVVHHSGKNAAQGARGWSGIRAAIDTEIEVTDNPDGRCAEVTKQRDLGTKAERIGFRLRQVVLGLTKFGKPATTCVVESADAPPPAKQQAKRMSEIAGAIDEFLRAKGSGAKKKDIVGHFDGRYSSASVYRELKKMADAGAVFEVAGIVAINKGVPNGAD